MISIEIKIVEIAEAPDEHIIMIERHNYCRKYASSS
jgi:hypothetical protein